MLGKYVTSDVTSSYGSPSSREESSNVYVVYAVFLAVAMLVYHLVAEQQFSSLLTLSAIFQCLAFSLLGVQVITSGSVKGISAKSLQLDALSLVCRLSSTTWLQGYLPIDVTGDYLYQATDFVSLVMVLWLIYRVLHVQHATYEAEEDAMDARPLALGSLVLAAFLHADLNDRPIFDSLWMCSLFISAVAVLPQLWKMTHSQGAAPALTSHFVAVMAFSRIVSGTYMWYAYPEITCEPWIGEFQHARYAVLGGHLVHLVMLVDFAYYYAKNIATSGLDAPLHLSECWNV